VSDAKIRENRIQNRKTRDAVLPAQPSESAERKKSTKLTADGLRVQSFDTLIADLATKLETPVD